MVHNLRRSAWNWLPAFFEVAETGSIAAASRQLSLTPAAISRTIRLLEDELGEPLFNRVGRQLALNQRGAALRDALRGAVAAVDAGIAASLGDPFAGPLRVASIGVLTDQFVVPALIELKSEHAQLIPEHQNLGPADANSLLARGQLHVAFYYEELTSEHVVVERIGQLSASVYCGKGHPLFGKRRITRAEVLTYPFSVPQIGDSGRVMDGWPPDIERQVGMRITMLRSNLDVSLSGCLLTVLPDVTAAPHRKKGTLRRLPFDEVPGIEVFCARHKSSAGAGAAQELVSLIRAAVERATRQR